MTRPAARAAGAPADVPPARARWPRLALGLMLDMIDNARAGGNALDTLLASAVIQANVAEINRRADLQTGFAETNEIPPDELRRPVSVNALAASLGLPFETVRRRISGMVRDGFCKVVEGGVIVPSAVLSDPKYFASAFKGYEQLRAFYYQAKALGVLGELPAPTVDLSAQAFPMRTLARLAGVYILRVVETLGAAGDLVDGLIWMETLRANLEGLPPEAIEEEADDALRTPIPISGVAARLGMPPETVRRHAADLVERGCCARTGGGLIVPAAALKRPDLHAILAGNAQNVARLFSALSQLGILKVWDGIQPGTPAGVAIPQNG